MTKLEELFEKDDSSMPGDEEYSNFEYSYGSMHWKTKLEREVPPKQFQNHEPQCLCDTIRGISSQYVSKEVQEVIIGILLMIGIWTITKWMISIIFSLMWPLLLMTGLILAIPTWRNYITDEYLPDNFNIMDSVTRKLSSNAMAFTNCS